MSRPRSAVVVFAFFACVVAAHCVAALTFSMAPGTTKCFTDDLSAHHRYYLEYSMPKARAIFTTVTLTSPEGKALFEDRRMSHKNRYIFQPATPGDHAVCFTSAEKRAQIASFDVTVTMLRESDAQQQRSIEFAPGQTADPTNQRNRALMVQAKYASDNLATIHDDFRNFMEREARMRITTETAFTRSNVFAAIAVLVIVAVAALGYLTLKRHLYSKKILE
jgi:hypothetical protein